MHSMMTMPGTGEVRLSTGVRLRYVEQGDPAGHPVLLLHGYTDSSYSFSLVQPLFDRRYRTFALDMRGHGDSERPAAGYALSDFAADVVAFMDELGLQSAPLIGHCMGSLVAQRVALVAPGRVERLALISSMTAARKLVGAVELQEAVEALDGAVPAEFAREFQAGTVYGGVTAEFMGGVVAESLKVPARVWRAALRGILEDEHVSRLGRIRAPSHLFWGERDALLTRAEQETLAALVNAELTSYPETGHSPHWERPEQVVRDLESFIGR
jgi:pimeloyl-ACP methyl ester carboxylesterase